MLISFILVVHTILAVIMVVLILLQKSEGGGFTGGGSSSTNSLVSARGQGDILSRSTAVTATLFILTSLLLAWLAAHGSQPRGIDTSLARPAAPAEAPATPALPSLPGTPVAPAPGESVPVAN